MGVLKDERIFGHIAAGGVIGKTLLMMVEENWDEWIMRYNTFFPKARRTAEEVFVTAVWSVGMNNDWFPWRETRHGFGMCLEIWLLQQWLVELCLRTGVRIFSGHGSEHPKKF